MTRIINYIKRLRRTQAKVDREDRLKPARRKEIDKLKEWKREHVDKNKGGD